MAQEGSRKQGRSLILTWFGNESADDAEVIERELANYTYVAQLERGANSGRLHWQIYIENGTPIAWKTLQNKLKGVHIEPRRGSRLDAFNYCQKEETFAGVRLANGSIDLSDGQGARNDLEEIRTAVMLGKSPEEVLIEYPSSHRYVSYVEKLFKAQLMLKSKSKPYRDVEAHYVFGNTGVGKTFGLNVFDPDDLFEVNDYAHPFDLYRGERVLVLDEYSSELDFKFFLKVLDTRRLEMRARYGNTHALWNTVLVISNEPFEELYSRERLNRPQSYEALKRRFWSITEVPERDVWLDRTEDYGVGEFHCANQDKAELMAIRKPPFEALVEPLENVMKKVS